MQTQTFCASTQHGDWLGTSAADGAAIRKWVEDQGLVNEGEFVLGLEMCSGESHGVHKDPVNLNILLAQPGDHDNIKLMLDATKGPVLVRRVSVELSLLEFFGLFKRFSIKLSSHGMLGERQYTFLDY